MAKNRILPIPMGEGGGGSQGVQGIQGTQGLQGFEGLQGYQGAPVSTSTIQAVVTFTDSTTATYNIYIEQ